MILPKKALLAFAIVLSTIITTIVLVYLARVAIVKSFSEEELTIYHAKITCLDFHLTTGLKLAVSRLCLQTPQADIKIEDMAIKFDLAAKQKIKLIDIASATIKGTADLFTEFKSKPQKSNDATLAQLLDSYLTQVSQVNLPFNINVTEIRYSPFALENNKKINGNDLTETVSYSGKFSAVQNTIEFSLKDLQQTKFFTAKFSTTKQNEQQLTAEFTGQLAPFKSFLLAHKLPLSQAILDNLDKVEASGEFQSILNYQVGKLTLNSQLTDFSLAASQSIEASGPFELTGVLNLHSEINLSKVNLNKKNQTIDNDTELGVEFQTGNTLQLNYSHQNIIDYLSKSALSPQIITLLIDNPINQLAFSPKGKFTYKLNNQQMSLSGIEIEAKSDQQVHQLDLYNIELDLNHYLTGELTHKVNHSPTLVQSSVTENSNAESMNHSKKKVSIAQAKENIANESPQNESPQFAQLDFKLDSQLLLSTMNNFTHSPIILKLQGSISQNHMQTTINFDENSSLTSNKIAMSTKQKTGVKKLFSIKQLATKIQGNVQIKNKQSISLNLNLNSQAKKLRAANIIEIKKLTVNTGVTGNLSDIKIHATATADNVPVGNLAISGPLDKPNVALTAKALQLTELLSLNIKLPKKIALVDGELSYSAKGQVTDLKNIQNTPLALSVAITSLSGEIEDIWIQELNWQQNFQYLAGEFSTLDDSPENSEENLTVALVDTPTPISKISFNTSWRYQKDFKISATKLKGDILGGSFSIPKIQWPLDHDHSVDVQLSSIDLEQVLALDKKQGIVVTGNISGQLPIRYNGEKYTMEKGELHNVSNGLIQVINNPAVEELKASNTQLQLAFDALQNLHYHQLSSDVSMADDGYMLLKTVIKGRNPDIDNDVNLNLNLSYDILGLLESMSITKQFEERIIKGLQKN